MEDSFKTNRRDRDRKADDGIRNQAQADTGGGFLSYAGICAMMARAQARLEAFAVRFSRVFRERDKGEGPRAACKGERRIDRRSLMLTRKSGPDPQRRKCQNQDRDELKSLCGDVERSLIKRFLTEHQVTHALMRASSEEIKGWLANNIRRMTEEGEAECLGLLAMWLVLESPRETLVNLAVWLEIQGSPDFEDAVEPPRDEE